MIILTVNRIPLLRWQQKLAMGKEPEGDPHGKLGEKHHGDDFQ